MGTDIHGVFERRHNGKWERIETEYSFGRHYFLFACLAGVRNGFGFAGVPTHSPVRPIAEPRGLPEDLNYSEKDGYANEPDFWFGDHSHSWLTGEEILAYSWPTIARTGVMNLEDWEAWDKISPPNFGYSGSVSGPGIKISSPQSIEPSTTHVRAIWVSPPQCDYFLDEVRRLVTLHGEIRFVFGFDS